MFSFVKLTVASFVVGLVAFSSAALAGIQYTPEFSYDFGGVLCRENACRSFSVNSGDRVIQLIEGKPGIYQGRYEKELSLDGHSLKYSIEAVQTIVDRRHLLKYTLSIIDQNTKVILGSTEIVLSRNQKMNLLTVNGSPVRNQTSELRPYLLLGPIEDTLNTTDRAFEELR